MKFFCRYKEIEKLQKIRESALQTAQFTIVVGRRRIGKTSVVLKAYENEPMLYFFVSRKSEAGLCRQYSQEVENKLGISTFGGSTSFAELFEELMKLSQEQSFTLFIDEFQEFSRINSSIYSDIQRLWDLYHSTSKINLIVCGSINSMMSKIFKDSKEPLYNRQTNFMTIRAFDPATLKEILSEYNPTYTSEDLLALFTFTGGVAKYVQLLMDAGAVTKEAIIDYIIEEDSMFLSDGKAILIEEFGKEYGISFSILSAIASGHTSRGDIEDMLGKEIGGYLTRLEYDYELIRKRQPLFEKAANKSVRYEIEDNFFTFWFRFVYKYSYLLEIEQFDLLKQIVNRDYETFSGKMLERYFKQVFIQKHTYTRLGAWWDRKGENEIDLVAENELNKEVEFIEIKRKEDNFSRTALEKKVEVFLKATHQYSDYTISLKALSMEDM